MLQPTLSNLNWEPVDTDGSRLPPTRSGRQGTYKTPLSLIHYGRSAFVVLFGQKDSYTMQITRPIVATPTNP
jgi:hypothetical protein